MYKKYFKRFVDIICALSAIVVFSWLYIIIAVLVRIKLGSPVIFKQYRPGKDEKIFTLYKFRTMTDKRDETGKLLPDNKRVTPFGVFLRKSSFDELPEAFNILKGDMSLIGPRPQLVRDMVFMTPEQRKRHSVKPGLSGLAQISGRNDLPWEQKFEYDLEYIKDITFGKDLVIIFKTIVSAFIKREGAGEASVESPLDFGDYLLENGKISQEEYILGHEKAKDMIEGITHKTAREAIYS
ncbi:MAG: sugar transferase [Clostridia bacterium]|nr:sugar transferase [Clostridia bacterium]